MYHDGKEARKYLNTVCSDDRHSINGVQTAWPFQVPFKAHKCGSSLPLTYADIHGALIPRQGGSVDLH